MRLATSVVAVLVLMCTAGCNDVQPSGEKGFVSGDQKVRIVAVDQRSTAISHQGVDLDGNPLSLADYRGKPVVIVVWGSWCTFCRAEAKEVQHATDQLHGTAQFIGIDLQDKSPAQAQGYVRTFGIDYPSFYSKNGDAMLAFPGVLSLRSIPAFVVLDAEGRVAGSIMGQLPSERTLVDLVGDVADEPADETANG